MAQTESGTDKADKASPSSLIPPEFVAIGQQRLKDVAAMQTQLFENLQGLSRNWLDRMQSEAALASEFATKLTVARSIPGTAAVYQEWANRRMELAAEDAKRLVDGSQKFVETSTRLLSSGWPPDGRGARRRPMKVPPVPG
jgi:hypothetical protein